MVQFLVKQILDLLRLLCDTYQYLLVQYHNKKATYFFFKLCWLILSFSPPGDLLSEIYSNLYFGIVLAGIDMLVANYSLYCMRLSPYKFNIFLLLSFESKLYFFFPFGYYFLKLLPQTRLLHVSITPYCVLFLASQEESQAN